MPGTDNRGFLIEERDKDLDQVSEWNHCPFFFFFLPSPSPLHPRPLEFLSRHFGGKDLDQKFRNYLGSQKYGMKVFFKWFQVKGLYSTAPHRVP